MVLLLVSCASGDFPLAKYRITLQDEDAIYERCVNIQTKKVPIQTELDDIRIALAGGLRAKGTLSLLVDTQSGKIELEGV